MTEEDLKQILLVGQTLSAKKYHDHCALGHVKTFYFFCRSLSREPSRAALLSTDLRDDIVKELGAEFTVKRRFNPEGHFGKAWSDWLEYPEDRGKQHFSDRYFRVLTRSGNDPYSYELNPKFFDFVTRFFRGEIEDAEKPEPAR